jgi:hypothetical protein
MKFDYNKFLACDFMVFPFGDKSNLDDLDIDVIYETFKYFIKMEEINKICLSSKKIKTICCNNRSRIFIKIMEYIGYTKKINKDNAEAIFLLMNKETNRIYDVKIDGFYILNFEFNDPISLAVIIIASVNDKIKINDISYRVNYKFWKFYPIIYYYTKNVNIKKVLLYEYNKIKTGTISRGIIDYYFVNNNDNNVISFINNVIIPRSTRLTDTDLVNYSTLVVNSIKRTRNPFIDY